MRKGFAILVVVLLCCGFVPQHKATRQKSPQKSISELYAEALKHTTIHKDTVQALESVRAIFQQDSNYAPALNLMSRLTQDPKKSAYYSERAYLLDTTNHHYLENYGGALILAEEYDKAVPILRKIVRKSTEPNHYRVLAIILNNHKKSDEALAVLDTAMMRFGRMPWLSRMRQYYLLRQGKTLMAVSDAQQALEEAPYLAENHIALAEIYAMLRRDSLAMDSFRNAIAIDTLAAEPWLALAEYHQNRGDKAAYLSVLERIFLNDNLQLKGKIEEWKSLSNDLQSYRDYFMQYDALIKHLYIHYPDSREVAEHYAQHLIRAGDIDAALSLCKSLIDSKSPKLEQYTRVIEIEHHLNHPDSVRRYTDLALEKFPHNTDLLGLRATLAMERKEYDSAISLYNEALKHANNDTLRSSIMGYIGDIEHARDDMKRCYKAYNKALKYFADNSSVLNNYAYFLSLEERDLERALEMISRALECSQNNSTYLDTMAWVLYKLGRYTEAKKYMQQALSLDRSRGADYALHYGDILHALGEEFMAKTYWRKALERGADKEEIERRFMPKAEESQPKRVQPKR